VFLGHVGRSIADVWDDGQTRLALLATALLMFARDSVIIVYGAWMEDTYGLTVTVLGLVTLVIGGAELMAELAVALFSDRLGKRRAVILGVAGMMVAVLLLPYLTGDLVFALIGSMFFIFAFEFSIVGLIPLVSGLNATARGTLMSLNVAAGSVGRMVGPLVAVVLYRSGDLTRNGLVSAVVCLLVLVLLSRIHERGH
jgi:predicted MFS family arabinose efflux permease